MAGLRADIRRIIRRGMLSTMPSMGPTIEDTLDSHLKTLEGTGFASTKKERLAVMKICLESTSWEIREVSRSLGIEEESVAKTLGVVRKRLAFAVVGTQRAQKADSFVRVANEYLYRTYQMHGLVDREYVERRSRGARTAKIANVLERLNRNLREVVHEISEVYNQNPLYRLKGIYLTGDIAEMKPRRFLESLSPDTTLHLRVAVERIDGNGIDNDLIRGRFTRSADQKINVVVLPEPDAGQLTRFIRVDPSALRESSNYLTKLLERKGENLRRKPFALLRQQQEELKVAVGVRKPQGSTVSLFRKRKSAEGARLAQKGDRDVSKRDLAFQESFGKERRFSQRWKELHDNTWNSTAGLSFKDEQIRFTEGLEELVREVVDGVTEHFGINENDVALLAVGSFGRRELVEGSDIDVWLLASDRMSQRKEWIEVTAMIRRILTDHFTGVAIETRPTVFGEDVNHFLRFKKSAQIITSALDARYLSGSKSLFDDWNNRFRYSYVPIGWWRRLNQYRAVWAVLAERQWSYRKLHQLEPDIKESMRDFQRAQWLAELGGTGFHEPRNEYEELMEVRQILYEIVQREGRGGVEPTRLTYERQLELARLLARKGWLDGNKIQTEDEARTELLRFIFERRDRLYALSSKIARRVHDKTVNQTILGIKPFWWRITRRVKPEPTWQHALRMAWTRRFDPEHAALYEAVQQGRLPEGFRVEWQYGDFITPDYGAHRGQRLFLILDNSQMPAVANSSERFFAAKPERILEAVETCARYHILMSGRILDAAAPSFTNQGHPSLLTTRFVRLPEGPEAMRVWRRRLAVSKAFDYALLLLRRHRDLYWLLPGADKFWNTARPGPLHELSEDIQTHETLRAFHDFLDGKRAGLDPELTVRIRQIWDELKDEGLEAVLNVGLWLHRLDHNVSAEELPELARSYAKEWGLDAREAELVAWLVQHHFELIQLSHRLPLDPEALKPFIENTLQSDPTRLKLLLMTTVAEQLMPGSGGASSLATLLPFFRYPSGHRTLSPETIHEEGDKYLRQKQEAVTALLAGPLRKYAPLYFSAALRSSIMGETVPDIVKDVERLANYVETEEGARRRVQVHITPPNDQSGSVTIYSDTDPPGLLMKIRAVFGAYQFPFASLVGGTTDTQEVLIDRFTLGTRAMHDEWTPEDWSAVEEEINQKLNEWLEFDEETIWDAIEDFYREKGVNYDSRLRPSKFQIPTEISIKPTGRGSWEIRVTSQGREFQTTLETAVIYAIGANILVPNVKEVGNVAKHTFEIEIPGLPEYQQAAVAALEKALSRLLGPWDTSARTRRRMVNELIARRKNGFPARWQQLVDPTSLRPAPPTGRTYIYGDLDGSLGEIQLMLFNGGLVDLNGDLRDDVKGVTVRFDGDFVGRQKSSLETYAYLRKLRRQAQKNGNGVVLYIGNHEFQILLGDPVPADEDLGEEDLLRIRDWLKEDIRSDLVRAADVYEGRLISHAGLGERGVSGVFNNMQMRNWFVQQDDVEFMPDEGGWLESDMSREWLETRKGREYWAARRGKANVTLEGMAAYFNDILKRIAQGEEVRSGERQILKELLIFDRQAQYAQTPQVTAHNPQMRLDAVPRFEDPNRLTIGIDVGVLPAHGGNLGYLIIEPDGTEKAISVLFDGTGTEEVLNGAGDIKAQIYDGSGHEVRSASLRGATISDVIRQLPVFPDGLIENDVLKPGVEIYVTTDSPFGALTTCARTLSTRIGQGQTIHIYLPSNRKAAVSGARAAAGSDQNNPHLPFGVSAVAFTERFVRNLGRWYSPEENPKIFAEASKITQLVSPLNYDPQMKGRQVKGRYTVANQIGYALQRIRDHDVLRTVLALKLTQLELFANEQKKAVRENRSLPEAATEAMFKVARESRHVYVHLAKVLGDEGFASKLKDAAYAVEKPEESEMAIQRFKSETGMNYEEADDHLKATTLRLVSFLTSRLPTEEQFKAVISGIVPRVKGVASTAQKGKKINDYLGIMLVAQKGKTNELKALLYNFFASTTASDDEKINFIESADFGPRSQRKRDFEASRIYVEVGGRPIYSFFLIDTVSYEKYYYGTDAHWSFDMQKSDELNNQSAENFPRIHPTGDYAKDFHELLAKVDEYTYVQVVNELPDRVETVVLQLPKNSVPADAAADISVNRFDDFYPGVQEADTDVSKDGRVSYSPLRALPEDKPLAPGSTIVISKKKYTETRKVDASYVQSVRAKLLTMRRRQKDLADGFYSGTPRTRLSKLKQSKWIGGENASTPLINDALIQASIALGLASGKVKPELREEPLELLLAFEFGILDTAVIREQLTAQGRSILAKAYDKPVDHLLQEEQRREQEAMLGTFDFPVYTTDDLMAKLAIGQITAHDIKLRHTTDRLEVEPKGERGFDVIPQNDRPGIVREVLKALRTSQVSIASFQVLEGPNKPIQFQLRPSTVPLAEMLKKIKQIPDVKIPLSTLEKVRKWWFGERIWKLNVIASVEDKIGALDEVVEALWQLDPRINILSAYLHTVNGGAQFVMLLGVPDPKSANSAMRRVSEALADRRATVVGARTAGARAAVIQDLQAFGIQTAGGRIDFSNVPQDVPWVMDRIRDIEYKPVVSETETLRAADLVYLVEDLPPLDTEASEHNGGVYVGLIRNNYEVHPAVIKMFNTEVNADQVKAELILAQIYDRLGINPRFYGVVKDAQGRIIGYAMQLVVAQTIHIVAPPSKSSAINLRLHRGLSFLVTPQNFAETRTGNIVGLDSGVEVRDLTRVPEAIEKFFEFLKKTQAESGARVATRKRLSDEEVAGQLRKLGSQDSLVADLIAFWTQHGDENDRKILLREIAALGRRNVEALSQLAQERRKIPTVIENLHETPIGLRILGEFEKFKDGGVYLHEVLSRYWVDKNNLPLGPRGAPAHLLMAELSVRDQVYRAQMSRRRIGETGARVARGNDVVDDYRLLSIAGAILSLNKEFMTAEDTAHLKAATPALSTFAAHLPEEQLNTPIAVRVNVDGERVEKQTLVLVSKNQGARLVSFAVLNNEGGIERISVGDILVGRDKIEEIKRQKSIPELSRRTERLEALPQAEALARYGIIMRSMEKLHSAFEAAIAAAPRTGTIAILQYRLNKLEQYPSGYKAMLVDKMQKAREEDGILFEFLDDSGNVTDGANFRSDRVSYEAPRIYVDSLDPANIQFAKGRSAGFYPGLPQRAILENGEIVLTPHEAVWRLLGDIVRMGERNPQEAFEPKPGDARALEIIDQMWDILIQLDHKVDFRQKGAGHYIPIVRKADPGRFDDYRVVDVIEIARLRIDQVLEFIKGARLAVGAAA